MTRSAANLRVVIAALGACFVGALASNIPLFFANRIFCSEDLNAYYRWTAQFTQAVAEGVWRPRWDSLGTEGLGSPAFLFVGPLYFYVAAVFRGLGLDVWAAMRVATFAATFFAGVFTWLLLRRYVTPRWAVIGACGLQWSPILFHILSLHNLFAMHAAIAPLLALTCATFLDDQPRIRLGVALSTAALTLTHPLVAFMAVATMPFAFLPSLLLDFRNSWRRALAWGASCVLGLVLAGYFLFPSLALQRFVLIEEWFEPAYRDWRNSFILPLVTSRFYGVRWRGVQWGLGSLAALCAFALVTKRNDRIALSLGAVVTAAFFFAWEGSFGLWKFFSPLRTVQWPYRFLLVALPLGWIGLTLQAGRKSNRSIVLATMALSVAMFLGIQLKNRVVLTRPDFATLRVQDYMLAASAAADWKTWLREGGFEHECAAKGVAVREETLRTHERVWRLVVNDPVELRFPLFYCPAWEASVNGKIVASRQDAQTGLLTIALPAGDSEVLVRWRMTAEEKIGFVMTGIGVLIASMVWRKSRQRK